MKSFDFKRKDSVLRGQKDKSLFTITKKINWDRIIYFSLLIGLLIIVGRYSYYKFLFVKADGQIIFNSVDIQTIDDSRIISLPVHEGDEVKVGDTLFLYEEDSEEQSYQSDATISIQKNNSALNWKRKESIEISQQIQLKNNELTYLLNKLNRLKKDEEKVKNEVMVDALPKVEYHRLVNAISDLEQEVLLIQKEILILNNKLKQIQNLPIESVVSNGLGNINKTSPNSFISPIDGYISKIFKENYEVTLKSEVVMHLYQPKGVMVKAYFKQSDYNQIKKGDVVDVEFPDGKITKGIISMVLYETNRLPEEFQKKFEPTTRVINADIVPYSDQDLQLWKKYNKLSVTIRKEKY